MFDPYKSDVVIVGTGPVGATYARALLKLDPNVRVTMVDAGPQMSEKRGTHLRNHRVYQDNWNTFADMVKANLQPFSRPLKGGYQETLDPTAFYWRDARFNFYNPDQNHEENLSGAGSAYAVGGMSTLWTCATPRPHPTMERSDLINDKEWDDLFDVAEDFLRKSDHEFDFQRQAAVKDALVKFFDSRPADYPFPIPSDYPVQNLPMAARRRGTGEFGETDGYVKWTGVDDILAPVWSDEKTRDRLVILPEHLVTNLNTDRPRQAGRQIVSADVQNFQTLRSERITATKFVVATGPIFSPQLLWNSRIRHNALGRYLNDQPVASCFSVLSKDIVNNFHDERGHAGIDALAPNAAEPQVWVPVSEKRPWHVQVHQDPINFTTPGPELVDQRLLVFLQWFGMSEPIFDNRVTFSDKYADVMGMPQPTFHYTMPDAAAKRAHDMIGEMAEAALSVGGWLPGQLPQFEPPGSSLHLQSTTRMGSRDDGTSVVDVNSRHWGFDNLAVGGINVIPTATACNPTPTAVAIAVKSAAHMALGRDATTEEYRRLIAPSQSLTQEVI